MNKYNSENFRDIIQEISPLLDFSNSYYKDYNTKVEYKCLKHGICSSYPTTLLKGGGCRYCGQKKAVDSVKLNTQTFIKKAKSIHGIKYNYDKVNYVSSLKKIILKCNTCNTEFVQMANSHFKKDGGCPCCKNKKLSLINSENPLGWGYTNWKKAAEISKYFDSFKVYIIECFNDTERFIKIGRTFCTIKSRFKNKEFMPYNYHVLKIYTFKESIDAFNFENKLKIENKILKYFPLISFRGEQECFDLELKNNIV